MTTPVDKRSLNNPRPARAGRPKAKPANDHKNCKDPNLSVQHFGVPKPNLKAKQRAPNATAHPLPNATLKAGEGTPQQLISVRERTLNKREGATPANNAETGGGG